MRNRALPWALAAATAVLSATAVHPDPAAAAFGDRALRKGHRGHDVRVLQRWLTVTGFRTSVDGRFGRRTRSAVRRYERRHDLHVDGRVSRGQARGLRKRARRAHAGAEQAAATQRAATTSGARATLSEDGRTALAPAAAPKKVKDAIAAANEIVDRPYRYGGGHGSFEDSGYDCSGAVSYALHGAGLLGTPRDSSGLMSFGAAGEGRWITVYAHGGHAYVVIAGLRFDTSGEGEEGPRWRPESRSPGGYTVRHPAGL
jgi:cell wall-associated NlpC family hydrolase